MTTVLLTNYKINYRQQEIHSTESIITAMHYICHKLCHRIGNVYIIIMMRSVPILITRQVSKKVYLFQQIAWKWHIPSNTTLFSKTTRTYTVLEPSEEVSECDGIALPPIPGKQLLDLLTDDEHVVFLLGHTISTRQLLKCSVEVWQDIICNQIKAGSLGVSV